ncbi:MAG TPA: 6-carboxytetrahydropterin synthase, partial [Leptospiraceae bacterium]|nr:6-carboxytetrahydropterin synthase [Leptospiraceae bacterium]
MQEIEIIKEFNFDAAHFLPKVPEGHKCRRMHGHTFYFKIHLKGKINSETGWLMDFGEIKKIVRPLIDNY